MKMLIALLMGLSVGMYIGDRVTRSQMAEIHRGELATLQTQNAALQSQLGTAARLVALQNEAVSTPSESAPTSGNVTARYYGTAGRGGYWSVERDRYPGTSSRSRVGGGQ